MPREAWSRSTLADTLRLPHNYRMKLTSSAIGLCGPADHRTEARSLARTRLDPQLMRGR
jgi:hypothetical protein